MKSRTEYTYNERLFSSGIRGKLHLARFYWLRKSLTRLNCQYTSVAELGCFDGKALEFLPVQPARYLGFDANWEGGLDLARQRWGHLAEYDFRDCQTPEDMRFDGETVDVSICMETLEHVAPDLVEPYLRKLAEATRQYIFITVPNEKGIVFLFKHFIKKWSGGDPRSYTNRELLWATLGQLHKVKRDNHKGFDYDEILHRVSRYFDLYEARGYPFHFLPKSLNFGVVIIGRARRSGS